MHSTRRPYTAARLTLLSLLLLTPSLFLQKDGAAAERAKEPVEIHVDMRHAPQRILHAQLEMPVEPGPLTLLYPKYMPGEHGPTGPISELVALVIKANGEPIAWNRDSHDVFTFYVDVPAGVSELEIELDYLPPRTGGMFGNGPSTSDQVAVMSWNTMLLYPAGVSIHELIYRASLTLPDGWEYGTALRAKKSRRNRTQFEDVSLAELIDSPVTTGAHHRKIDLTGSAAATHRLNLSADSEAALEIRPETEAALRKLVAEGIALFDSYHYRSYDFLLTLSDHIDSFGLEHHESSDNRLPERSLIDDAELNSNAGLLPHEYVHSWNAKTRRPAGLTRDDYQKPYEADLLWVYEGLTSYLGRVLTSRSGLWQSDYARDSLALIAAGLANRPGRSWRPLVDTTRAAYTLYGVPSEWKSWRRGVDFYNEGVLIWLEVDTQIRSISGNTRSLDDFCGSFFGGASGQPELKPFTYDELIQELNRTAAYDWKKFFDDRIYSVAPNAPLGGIDNAGWKLVYTEEPNLVQKDYDETGEGLDLRFSLGIQISTENGRIGDVLPGSPAAAADIAPGSKLIAVNGRRWSSEILQRAIDEAVTNGEPIRLLVENSEFFREAALEYDGGERYPHLERVEKRTDLLSQILAPRTP
ncbi:MAG: PDZ domain-containing protein [Deltaproteobacteria bacterium]|nr:PDZ domain-containing protein [Deltaproteobacteria bacterium]MBW2691087.1 PDZ domain-containing protein [Deltaproteobacteria bacterium]